jgi:hypothetical protein
MQRRESLCYVESLAMYIDLFASILELVVIHFRTRHLRWADSHLQRGAELSFASTQP